MSRTYKTRPMWVQNNDPKGTPFKHHHDHRVTLSEVVGYEEYEPFWDKGTTRQRPLYRRWSEPVPCTIDVPEQTTSSWRYRRPRVETNDDRLNDKHCDTRLLWYSETWRSKKDMKRLTNGALRTKVKQQLHMAVRDNGWSADPDLVDFVADGYDDEGTIWKAVPFNTWWDLDIYVDDKYIWSCWWD